MTYGYARASTTAERQDVGRQVDWLEAAGADVIVSEYGSAGGVRPEFSAMLGRLGRGDVVAVSELSRLTRSVAQLVEICALGAKLDLKIKIGGLVFAWERGKIDAFGLAMLQIMAVFAELERNMAADRIRSGIEHARKKGKKFGRPVLELPPKFVKIYPNFLQGVYSVRDIMKICKLSRSTAYKYIRIARAKNEQIDIKTVGRTPPR